MTEQHDLPAGRFSTWLRRTRSVQRRGGTAVVPCGSCTACCTSSYFVHVGPDETAALACIPRELLFPAPGLPAGTLLLGYDERGHCPMLVDHVCTIYEHRPQTCRSYDCRVLTAAGMPADRALITDRTRRWAFEHVTEQDRRQHASVRAAATFLQERAACFPGGAVPGNPADVAILAIKVYEVFLDRGGEPGKAGRVRPDEEVAAACVRANARFEAVRRR